MIEYATMESVLDALAYLDQSNTEGRYAEAKEMLVKRTFQMVGIAANLSGTAGGFTQSVFKGNEVKDGDRVYVEVKNG